MVVRSADTNTNVVLLPGRDCYSNLDESAEGSLPPLHGFLGSMMGVWTGISSQNYEDRLLFVLYVARLIKYCCNLKDEDDNCIKGPAYAKMLQPSHRELHYNTVSEDCPNLIASLSPSVTNITREGERTFKTASSRLSRTIRAYIAWI